jgi:hypothetical protein
VFDTEDFVMGKKFFGGNGKEFARRMGGRGVAAAC